MPRRPTATRPRRACALAVIAVIGVVLAACSDGGPTGSDPTSTTLGPTTVVATAPTPAATTPTTPTTPATSAAATVAPATTRPAAVAVDVSGEWAVADPADVGVDADGLEAAREYAFAPDRHTQGVVVAHRGVIVAEWYADGADASSWTASWSVAKSFAGAVVGIAVDEGAIAGVDEPMTTWFPEWTGTDRASITLRDVLQMSSGLDWDEAYDPARAADSEIAAMVTGQADQLAFAAARPAEVAPGTRWSYSSGDTMLLSGVVERATGEPLAEFAAARLFEPIGMEQAEWWADAAGHTLAYCCLDSSSRDLARFGWLYARGGRWGDRQVVPASWVADSLTPAPTSLEDGAVPYGYQWWLELGDGLPDDGVAARGINGQYVYVIPSLELVVVRNGTYVKHDGPAIADPNLFERYPPSGLVEGRGTIGPASWDDTAFLGPIVDAVAAAG